MRKNLPKYYEGYCKTCNEQHTLYYNGIQRNENDLPYLHLLTCVVCHNTQSIPLEALEDLVEVNIFKVRKEMNGGQNGKK